MAHKALSMQASVVVVQSEGSGQHVESSSDCRNELTFSTLVVDS